MAGRYPRFMYPVIGPKFPSGRNYFPVVTVLPLASAKHFLNLRFVFSGICNEDLI